MADLAKETDNMDVVRLIVELAKATKSDVLAFITEQAAAEGWTVPQYMFLQASRAGLVKGRAVGRSLPSGWRRRLSSSGKHTELMAAASGISVSQYLDQKTAELARAANMTVPQYRRHQLRLQGQMNRLRRNRRSSTFCLGNSRAELSDARREGAQGNFRSSRLHSWER